MQTNALAVPAQWAAIPMCCFNYTHGGDLGEKPNNNLRFLEAFGRDVDLPSTEIDYDPETNALFCTNSGTTRIQAKLDARAKQAGVAVWNADERIKTGDLYKLLKWPDGGSSARDNAAALKRAVELKYIVQRESGKTKWNSRGNVDPRTSAEKEDSDSV